MSKYSAQIFLLTILFISVISVPAKAQIDTLHVGHVFKHADEIEDGESMYVIYREDTEGNILPFAMKRHTITHDGNEIKVVQEQFTPEQTKVLETWINPETLETSRHKRTTDGEIESYLFSEKTVTANPEIESKNEGFSVPLSNPVFNFEIDFEFMKVIAWEERDAVVISFYHPGGPKPQFYTFSVDGEEVIDLANGSSVDTWVIHTDYNMGQDARFWVSKSTREVIKQETDLTSQAGFKVFKLRTYPNEQ
jgi:hypothetical protein